MSSATVLVGTCGFCLARRQYYRLFSVVEVQQTFYQPPDLARVRRWRQEAPGDFQFTLKAFQAITHPGSSPTYRRSRLTPEEREQCGYFRNTPVVRQAWDITYAIAQELQARLVLFQCPASFTPTREHIADLRRFFSTLERERLLLAWEPRGQAWTDSAIRRLCKELHLIHAVDPFVRPSVFGTVRYYRLHGGKDYQHRYTDTELAQLRSLLGPGTNYVLFNNVTMREDAERFMKLCRR
ncbi:MAG: hypothetical protein C4297_12710 [Gemmataceae bacterium]